MIAPDDNDGLGSHGGIGIEGGEHAPQLIIRKTSGGEVAVNESARIGGVGHQVGARG